VTSELAGGSFLKALRLNPVCEIVPDRSAGELG
jgi:hypothetical protein